LGIKIFLMNREGIQTPTLPVEATGCFIEVKHWPARKKQAKKILITCRHQDFVSEPAGITRPRMHATQTARDHYGHECFIKKILFTWVSRSF